MAKKKNSASSSNSDTTMKIVMIGALLLAFLVGYLVARAKYKPQIQELTKMVANKDQAVEKMKTDANKIFMKDGKMWVVEAGIVKPMDSDMMMPNGVKVMTDGKVIDADGNESLMKNGDAMDMEGKMLPSGEADIDTSDARSF